MLKVHANSPSEKGKRLRSLSILIVLSTLGGATSVLVGYAGQLVSSFSILPFVASQLLSGYLTLRVTKALPKNE